MDLRKHVQKMLETRGYDYFIYSGCFDIIAKKRQTFLIKILDNADFSQADHEHLKTDAFTLAWTTIRPFERMQFLLGTEKLVIELFQVSGHLYHLRDRIHEFYKKELPDKQIVKMVTSNAAKAFKLRKNGYIKSGYIADFTVFSRNEKDPFKSIVTSKFSDVLLVVIDGSPVYGSLEYQELFDHTKYKLSGQIYLH